MNPGSRRIWLAAVVVAVVSSTGWLIYGRAWNSRVTADEVSQYARSTDLAGREELSRREALRRLENLINRLSVDERRKWRMDGAWEKWFDEMTETEKGEFIEATMPSGFKQWLDTFDGLPEGRRKLFIDYLRQRLEQTHRLVTDREPGRATSMYGTNAPPVLSAELERRAQTIGLRTFYLESSAETKAELAPFLEELQRQMQHGTVLPEQSVKE
jgi:hypothetical protein